MSGTAAIVGAGIFGSSLAYRLARDGWDVTLYERHEPGDERAASSGESRLIRYAHGSGDWYTRSAWRAHDLWRELEAETGRELLVECGVAWFARSEQGWEAESEQVLCREGIPVERLEPEAGRDFFPSFEPGDLRFILWEPNAGVLRAREATLATVEAAQGAGVQLRREEAKPDTVAADVVVWACGAWLRELLDYGHGDLDELGVKVAPDAEGPPFDPESGERTVSRETEATARSYLGERFPALTDAPLTGGTVCQYALTTDTNFVIARRPGAENEWILGGGSGHGFKHGPALAEYAARVVTGEEEPAEQFRLGPREHGPSLRTAGTT
jgi:glycine/D-amino acid oxidase-like deaminating enzyme